MIIEELIDKYFADKTDKGNHPYENHLYTVAHEAENYAMTLYPNKYVFANNVYIVGLLHDIFEDTECTEQELRDACCTNEIIEAVKAITRNKDEKLYKDFIKRVKENEIARIVKICDLEHNMDIRRLEKFGDYEMQRLRKYFYSWKYLKGELADNKYDILLNDIK